MGLQEALGLMVVRVSLQQGQSCGMSSVLVWRESSSAGPADSRCLIYICSFMGLFWPGFKEVGGGESCYPGGRVCEGERGMLLSHFTENPLCILEGCWEGEAPVPKVQPTWAAQATWTSCSQQRAPHTSRQSWWRAVPGKLGLR